MTLKVGDRVLWRIKAPAEYGVVVDVDEQPLSGAMVLVAWELRPPIWVPAGELLRLGGGA